MYARWRIEGTGFDRYYRCRNTAGLIGLPGPQKLADDLTVEFESELSSPRLLQWDHIEGEHDVPADIRRSTDKVMKKIGEAIVQGPDFFGRKRRK
ncbi:MAG: hypothetical protein NUV78_02040 [Candidatus Zambryskibacteria bacterium]|nr:hypothetical protein [Candidatus Zambryskibacteria bacterium]